MARSFASSRYNHRAVILTLTAVFKMAARFIDDSESEIDKLKKNAVPQKTKDATKFGVRVFKGSFCK